MIKAIQWRLNTTFRIYRETRSLVACSGALAIIRFLSYSSPLFSDTPNSRSHAAMNLGVLAKSLPGCKQPGYVERIEKIEAGYTEYILISKSGKR